MARPGTELPRWNLPMGGVTHVALFTWKPGTTDEQIQALTDALSALPGLIADIRSYRLGSDAGVVEGNDSFAMVAEFDDLDAYERYAADPRHRQVIEQVLRPILATRHAVQLVEPEYTGRRTGADREEPAMSSGPGAAATGPPPCAGGRFARTSRSDMDVGASKRDGTVDIGHGGGGLDGRNRIGEVHRGGHAGRAGGRRRRRRPSGP